MTVEETLKQRGSIYGEFTDQVHTVSMIIDSMKYCYMQTHQQEEPNCSIMAEWYYLAIKLARIAANPMHFDSIHDLAGYATLISKTRDEK